MRLIIDGIPTGIAPHLAQLLERIGYRREVEQAPVQEPVAKQPKKTTNPPPAKRPRKRKGKSS